MKKIIIFGLSIIMILSFSSCLEFGLEELETYTDTNITAINFEYRWMVPENPNDPWAGEKLQVKTLTTHAEIKEGVVKCNITVPDASGTFTEQIRNSVTLQNIIAYLTISPGATVKAVGSTPVLGHIGDFSKSELKYKVISADGKNQQEWLLVIESFNK
ncbi:MAG: DUF5018-related domain-containing protein [Fermentimonas caenicola]|jgi:hypothetical protein|uniref:DUF5018-related domain-containing protein n=1 Tax=Lascolabacillus sp. TaxID=1924068 RepID=UPI00258C8BCB|nr:hypothetical protein [Lascolabacillus sp.]MDD3657998.1 hypothetical protein [Lascolabacillus sp.]MDI9625645.1 hypothetical protein [Bacteroidota bacterium]